MVNINEIWKKINKLLTIYENYLFFHENSDLNIIIDNDTISFYLFDEEKEDEFILTFDGKDKKSLNYISTKVIIKLFGNVLMYFDEMTIYNKKHKAHITISVLNEEIKQIVEQIISVQEQEFINDDNKIVKDLKSKAKRVYPGKFMKILSDRVDISKKYLQK